MFQEPSLLSSLQDNKLTNVMLHALLVKDPPATREVLASLPNIFRYLSNLYKSKAENFATCHYVTHAKVRNTYYPPKKTTETAYPLVAWRDQCVPVYSGRIWSIRVPTFWVVWKWPLYLFFETPAHCWILSWVFWFTTIFSIEKCLQFKQIIKYSNKFFQSAPELKKDRE